MYIFSVAHRCWRRALPIPSLALRAFEKADSLLISRHFADGRKAIHCPALATDTLHVLQQKNRQLRAKLATLRWPPLTSFRLHGQSFLLPLQSEHTGPRLDFSSLAAHELEYLAGFFDGDGCVQAPAGSCQLSVSQPIDGVEVLKHFQGSLGGGIYRQSDGAGLRKPTLTWVLRGNDARHVASFLAKFSIVKRRQLEIVSARPAEHADTVDCSTRLSLLKRSDSSMMGACTWAYLAGFFDAEGYIFPRGKGASLQLKIAQKHITVLESLQAFFASETGFRPSVVQSSRGFDLRISTTSTCKFILQQMLDAGMLRKAAQARLALSLTSENAEEVRSKMAGMVGNQGFGRRLDGAGVRRASAIKLTQGLVKRVEMKGQDSLAQSIREDVEKQKHEHALLNARRVNHELHAYIDKIHALHQDPNSGDYQPFTPFPEHQAETSI